MDLLIKGATIITLDGENEVLKGDILIENGKISEISQSIELSKRRCLLPRL